MAKPGRNEPCPCGSGKKFKNCHESKTPQTRRSRVLMVVVGGAMLAAIAAGVASFTADRSTSGVRVWDPVHGHYHNAAGTQVP
jgi:preprotein translocase subunit SecA